MLQMGTDFFTAPIETLAQFYRELAEVDRGLIDDSISVRLLALVLLPFNLIFGFINLLVQSWPTSRPGLLTIVLAAPAVMTIAFGLLLWIAADFIYNQARQIGTNQAYYAAFASGEPKTPELALLFAKKLVEIDPDSNELKFNLGFAYKEADNPVAANDVIETISPDEASGYPRGHVWRANYLAKIDLDNNDTRYLDLIDAHIDFASAALPDNAEPKFNLAQIYSQYANSLTDQPTQRQELLEKAYAIYQEIATNKDYDPRTSANLRFLALGPSEIVRRELEEIDPEKYNSEVGIRRVQQFIKNLVVSAGRFSSPDTPNGSRLWTKMVQVLVQVRDFDFAVEVIDQADDVALQPATRDNLAKLKSVVYAQQAMFITDLSQFEAYQKRLSLMCVAAKIAPKENVHYLNLLQFVGNENPPPSDATLRSANVDQPVNPVPIKLDWLYRVSTDPQHSDIINLVIGIHLIHQGKFEEGVKSWAVAQQFSSRTADLLNQFAKLLAFTVNNNKFDNVDMMLSKALELYPESDLLYFYRGLSLSRQNRYAEAVQDFRIVIDREPNQLAIHRHLRYCYQKMGLQGAAAEEERILQAKISKLPPDAQQTLIGKLDKLERDQNSLNQNATPAVTP